MSYFISPPDDTSAFSLDYFHAELSQWEGIVITVIDDTTDVHALEWVVPMRQGDVFGAVDQFGEIVHLDGFLSDCALFALWLRTLVPDEIELLFYDENYSADVPLVAFTCESDLVRAFGT